MFRLSQSSRNRKQPQVSYVDHRDGFQVAWNFLKSFQLSDFNEMQSKVTSDFT